MNSQIAGTVAWHLARSGDPEPDAHTGRHLAVVLLLIVVAAAVLVTGH